MKKDLLISFFNYAFVFACGLIVYKISAKEFGPAGFGEYALARRTVSFLQPVLMVGLGVGLVRYIAVSNTEGMKDSALQAAYFVSGCSAVLAFSAVSLLAVNLAPGMLGRLVFGQRGYDGLVRSVSFLVFFYIINALVFAFYRGRGSFLAANMLSGLSHGLVPLLSLVAARSVEEAVEYNAAGIALLSAVFVVPVLRAVSPHVKAARIRPALRELLSYGLARVPGDVTLAGMVALPAFVAANIYGIKEAGYVAFGISLVNMVGAVFAPVGFVMLPRLSAIISEGRRGEARDILKRIIKYTALISAAATLALFVSAGYLVNYWLGAGFVPSIDIIRLAVLAAVPNALYVSLRSSIDAAFVKAMNASNIYKAFAVSAAAYAAVKAGNVGLIGVPASFLLGMGVLCLLTLRVAMSAYGLELKAGLARTKP